MYFTLITSNIPISFIEKNNVRDLSIYLLELANINHPKKDNKDRSTLKAGKDALFTWKD
jgi:hypothetical protein